MAVLTTKTVIPLGSRDNRSQSIVMIPAKAEADKPGVLVLQDVDDSAVVGEHYIWADSSNNIRVHTSMPTNQDSDGSALLTSASVTLDAAFGAGKYIDGSTASGAANAFSVGGAAADDKVEIYHTGSSAVINCRSNDTLSITSAGGAISFGNESLTTQGAVNIDADSVKLTIGDDQATDSYLQWDASNLEIFSAGSIEFLTTGDTNDYITFSTSGDVPVIGTSGGCDLKITSNSGDITFDDDNLTTTGNINVDSDSNKLTLGDDGSTDAYIYFDGTDMVLYDANYGSTVTLSQLMSGTTLSPIVTGDLTISDGQFDWTNTTAGDTNTWTFANTSAAVFQIVADSVTTGTVLDINADALTSGYMIHLDKADGATFSGGYLQCYDGSAADFAIKRYGEVELAGNAGADMFTITAGDFVMSDGSITVTDADNANTLAITNGSVTDGTLAILTADGLTSGSVLTLDADGGAGTGTYLLCYDGSANDLAIKNHGEIEITGNAGSDMFTITAGDVVLSDGSVTITDADNANTLAITNGSVTDGTLAIFTADGLTSGSILTLDADGGAGTGTYLLCYDGSANDLAIKNHGEVEITGNAGSDMFTITAGDVVLSDGSVTITDADNATTLAITNDTISTGTLIDVNADGITSGVILHLDSTAADFAGKYIQCYDGAADDFAVSANGAIAIAGSSHGTDAITVTAGDLTLTDGFLDLDATAYNGGHNIATADDGTSNTSLITVTNSNASFDQALLTIDANATGDVDTIVMTNAGTGASINITGGAAGSKGIEYISAASATAHGILLDGTTGSWVGAAGVGFLQMSSDGTLADADAHLVQIDKTGQTAASATGSSLHITDASTGGSTSGYAVYFNASGALEALHVDAGAVLIDEKITVTGSFLTPTDMTATDAGATISAGISYVHADETTGDDGDILTLPANVAGQLLIVLNDDAAQDFKLTAAAGETINGGAAAGAVTVGEDECVFLFAIDGTDWRAFKISGDGTLATAGQSA